jgi:predicted ArsR family transcriptional regulator
MSDSEVLSLKTHATSDPIDLLHDARRALLVALKRSGRATIPQLAQTLSITNEAVRQHVWALEKDGWIVSDCGEEEGPEARPPGRPPAEYCLSPSADDLFAKRYADVALMFFDRLADPEQTLAAITDQRVAGLGGPGQPVEALRSIYIDGDPYIDIETSEHGYRLIERNCPYLRFALERPLFCSTTVSTLRRLTGREVVREQRFQDRDGRCAFHIYTEAPLSRVRARRRFEREPQKTFSPFTKPRL